MVTTMISKWAQNDRGATMVEYGIAVVLAVLVGTSGLIVLGSAIDSNMNAAATRMDPANN